MDTELDRLVKSSKAVFDDFFPASNPQAQDPEFALMSKMLEATGEMRKRELAYSAAMHITKVPRVLLSDLFLTCSAPQEQYADSEEEEDLGITTSRMISSMLSAIVPYEEPEEETYEEETALASFRYGEADDFSGGKAGWDGDTPRALTGGTGFEEEPNVDQVDGVDEMKSKESKALLNNFLSMF